MILSEFLEELAYGEMSDTGMVEDWEFPPEQQTKVVIKLNDTLNHLFSKYILRLETGVLLTQIKRKVYSFDSPNCVRIIYVHPNVPDDRGLYEHKDLFRLDGNTLTFVKEPEADSFTLSYQWKPTRLKIRPTDSNFARQQLNLPDFLVPLAKTEVSSALFTAMNGELHKKTGIELKNMAQFMVSDLELSGLLQTSVGFESDRFKKNGFA